MKKFAVLQRWKENKKDFAVIEYCESIQEAKNIIKTLPKSNLYDYEVGEYIFS